MFNNNPIRLSIPEVTEIKAPTLSYKQHNAIKKGNNASTREFFSIFVFSVHQRIHRHNSSRQLHEYRLSRLTDNPCIKETDHGSQIIVQPVV